jgi:hypothetical protein
MVIRQIILIVGLVLAMVNGAARGQSEPQSHPSRIEVGALVSVLDINDANGLNDLFPRREFGFGGRASYNLNSHVALEAEINFFPRDFRKFTTNFTGGRMTEGLFGLKAGIRKNSSGSSVRGSRVPDTLKFRASLTAMGQTRKTLSALSAYALRSLLWTWAA